MVRCHVIMKLENVSVRYYDTGSVNFCFALFADLILFIVQDYCCAEYGNYNTRV